MTPALVDRLQPGDVLLYRARGFYGWLIALKTWHPISHVEVYVGGGHSVASRDGLGVECYPVRTADLARVLRPAQPIDLAAGMRWFETTARGWPYGWLDLLQFVGLPVDGPGIVCSPLATRFLRACGLPLFGRELPETIAPCNFLLSELLRDVGEDVMGALADGPASDSDVRDEMKDVLAFALEAAQFLRDHGDEVKEIMAAFGEVKALAEQLKAAKAAAPAA